MRNFETPKMEVAMFAVENILTESAAPTPTQLQAIVDLQTGDQGNTLVGQKSFTDLMKIAE